MRKLVFPSKLLFVTSELNGEKNGSNKQTEKIQRQKKK